MRNKLVNYCGATQKKINIYLGPEMQYVHNSKGIYGIPT